MRPDELKDKLFIVTEEDGGLSDEQIASLRRYVPTPDDVEMYKSYKGSPSELHLVDQYMMQMCNIPFLSARLDLLLTIRELPISMEDLQPLINQKTRMCSQLWNCKSFMSVLEYLLVVGNYLNENAGKERAKGFRLSSLTKLSQLRGKDRKFTLLHALVEQILLHNPDLAKFFEELTEFEAIPGASIKGLTAEVDVLKNELQKIVQYKKAYKPKNQGNQGLKFHKDLKMAIQKYEADLSQLTKKSEEMKKLYADILVKFAEPPEQDSQELFGWVCTFVRDFKRIYSEIVS
ncbi:FH6 protein, partial [Amia calva]|nr:FH6 protein [Amia calva]